MMMVDLHTHTTESDGFLSAPALVALVQHAGIDYFSITDHDTLAAYDRHPAALATLGSRLIRGMEVSSHAGGHDVHILAYGVGLGETPLSRLVAHRAAARRDRVTRILEKLAAAGIRLSEDDVARHARGAMVGRSHVARALVEAGHATGTDDAFRRFVGRSGLAFTPIEAPAASTAIAAIRESGGVSVLAHPSRGSVAALLPDLISSGLQGLEVFYAAHDASEIERYRTFAENANLAMTAGSDFHGASDDRRAPGCEVEARDLDPFLRLVIEGR